ncbi:Outer membrane receptor proteins, mostly Fe transport [Novosphingobium sp. CF614]|uniref:TonB-dependent receptor domain-containing protein n=1 Tax=Novosphingobium sp. CF614 TaxID=1884364 RepID=UPI0008EFA6A9|nr:TonB-dependent receptor [Novosphingobium sp. CF614]SFF87553.1 Outer membrane receptor proteins, mostly Fe transport [Novosphingobium sp. CF614]
MSLTSRLAGTLLITSAIVSPSLAFAQSEPGPATDPAPADTPPAGEEPAEPAQPDISVPGGGDIIVTGSRSRNVVKSSDQVVSVLTTAEIARTGEGNIAGALGRVTGLSVVGSGYVYVRGLGDRYSLALLNGSPLPSPEPLRRVVPLDIFPSGVIASSLVQKSYSVNFPGEFGGGVINLTTKAVPTESFLTIGGGFQVDSETTGEFGYSYFGAQSDWTGFDNGSRDVPPALQAFYDSGASMNSGTVDTRAIGAQLVRFSRATLQKVRDLPVNYSTSITAGTSFDLGGADLGVIAAAGFSNKWTNRQARQQTSFSDDLSTLQTDFNRITTDNRIVANGLLGLGLEFGQNKIRWTNLYIRDTIKQGRLGVGQRNQTTVDYMQQSTAWYERQLIDTQFVGEFKLAPGLSVDLRGGYANSQREAPYETFFEYVRTNTTADPYGQLFVNRLNGNNGEASVTFSDLNEDLWSAGVDVSYAVTSSILATVGGAFSDTNRVSSRRQFLFRASSTFPTEASVLRPDLLLSPGLVIGTTSGGTTVGGIDLIEPDEATPAFQGKLRNWAGYAKANVQFTDALSLDAGVRFEKARQAVAAVQVFTTPPNYTPTPALRKEYWLPAATLTWQIQPDLQFRLSGSKTIARPQFRELIYQPFFDPDSNRQYLGNPLLTDSQLYNAETRLEWYFAPEQRLSIAGFYKKIDKPIEAFITLLSDNLVTSYANAPEAQLYGAEIEATKYFDLSDAGGWLTDRRAVIVANYTYSKSKLKVSAGDSVAVYAASSSIATDYFRDGEPLTGQSDHLANLQLGLENTERLSQQTLLVSFASERVVSRGLNGSVAQPDIIEKPGIQLDFVAREGADFLGQEVELKFEARNLLGTRHREYQTSGDNTVEFNTYDVGTVISFSAQLNF